MTLGNPAPVYDTLRGTILLPYSRNNLEVFILRSSDGGSTWKAPQNISSQVMNPSWNWYATGKMYCTPFVVAVFIFLLLSLLYQHKSILSLSIIDEAFYLLTESKLEIRCACCVC